MDCIVIKSIHPYFEIGEIVTIKQETFIKSDLNWDPNWGRGHREVKGDLSFKSNTKIVFERFLRNLIQNSDLKNYFTKL